MPSKNDFLPSDKGVVAEYLEWRAPHKFPGEEGEKDHESDPQFDYKTGERPGVQLDRKKFQPMHEPQPALKMTNMPASYADRSFYTKALSDLSNLHKAFFGESSLEKRSKEARARREGKRSKLQEWGAKGHSGEGRVTPSESADLEHVKGKKVPGGKHAGTPASGGVHTRIGRRYQREEARASKPSASAIADTLGHEKPSRSASASHSRTAWAKGNPMLLKLGDLHSAKKFLPALAAAAPALASAGGAGAAGAGAAGGAAAGGAGGSMMGAAGKGLMQGAMSGMASRAASGGDQKSDSTKVVASDGGGFDNSLDNARGSAKAAQPMKKWDGSMTDPNPEATKANVERIRKAQESDVKDYTDASVRLANDHKHNLRQARASA